MRIFSTDEIDELCSRFDAGLQFIWMDKNQEQRETAVKTLRSCIDGTDSFGWRVIDVLANQNREDERTDVI